MTRADIIKSVAKNVGLSEDIVDRTYRAYWKAIREYLASLPLKEELSDDSFLSLRTSVNIPSIGKLFVTLGKYKAMKESYGRRKSNKMVLCEAGE